MNDKPYSVLYILGSGHCGSTILDILLNNIANIFSAGELHGIHRYLDISKNGYCPPANPKKLDWIEVDHSNLSDETWQKALKLYSLKSGNDFYDITFKLPKFYDLLFKWNADNFKAWGEANAILFDAIYEVTGAQIITDSSKRPHRLYALFRSNCFDLRVIHLVRDGRAVLRSYKRKYKSEDRRIIWRWASPNIVSFLMRPLFGKEKWVRVRYEDLVRDTQNELNRLKIIIDSDSEDLRIDLSKSNYKGIGGNRLLTKGLSILKLDDKWRMELSSRDKLWFKLRFGILNLLYGYR